MDREARERGKKKIFASLHRSNTLLSIVANECANEWASKRTSVSRVGTVAN